MYPIAWLIQNWGCWVAEIFPLRDVETVDRDLLKCRFTSAASCTSSACVSFCRQIFSTSNSNLFVNTKFSKCILWAINDCKNYVYATCSCQAWCCCCVYSPHVCLITVSRCHMLDRYLVSEELTCHENVSPSVRKSDFWHPVITTPNTLESCSCSSSSSFLAATTRGAYRQM